MPLPGSPIRCATAPLNSTSDEAFERLPTLSFSRWIATPLRDPSGSQPGTTKQEMPSPVRASVRNTSECGTEKNHFRPCSENVPSRLSSA